MHRFSALAIASLIALATLAGCTDPRLQSSEGNLAFTPEALELGATWEGEWLEQKVRITNLGKSPVTLEWTAPDAPFEVVDVPESLESAGEAELSVRFHAGVPGIQVATVKVKSNAGRSATLEVSATSKEIPPPPPPEACHVAIFQPKLNGYVQTPLPDGTACDAFNVCITGASCQAGQCLGKAIACDDGNSCTLNVCNASTGCEFPPAPPCPGDGKCQVGTCDPKVGCGLALAPDGTECGPVHCDATQVCVSGACVVRDPPDGYVCAEGSPCQDEGLCQGSICVQPPPVALAPSWSFDAAAVPDGGTTLKLHDMLMEPSGDLSLLGFFETAHVRESTGSAVVLPAPSRRCIGWGNGLACADYGPSATVASVGFDGVTRWTFNLAVERPDVAAENDNVFMARIASMGPDRLLAIYETYPKDAGPQTLCRGFYLVALNATGQLIWMNKLSDPLLSTCQHPHPYGLAVDSVGNIYVAFSTSFIDPGQAIPLAPQSPTLLMSFNGAGVQRWVRTENITGGELAVADGLLYPESAALPFDATTGTPLLLGPNTVRERMGRVVVTHDKYVTSPQDTGVVPQGELKAFARNGAHAWTHQLNAGDWFVTPEMQLIDWKSKVNRATKEAVLTFANIGTVNHALAVRATDGSKLWSCPLGTPAEHWPETLAVANGRFAMMSAATTCGTCDPPYAHSSATFWKFIAEGMKPSTSPWPGTFGGPLHDHLEKTPQIVTLPPN